MDQERNRDREDRSNLDSEMERDAEIRRDTQVRGSLGLPPSGNESGASRGDEGVPEFEDDRGERSERSDDRESER